MTLSSTVLFSLFFPAPPPVRASGKVHGTLTAALSSTKAVSPRFFMMKQAAQEEKKRSEVVRERERERESERREQVEEKIFAVLQERRKKEEEVQRRKEEVQRKRKEELQRRKEEAQRKRKEELQQILQSMRAEVAAEESIAKVIQRSEKLEGLEQKAEELSFAAAAFKKAAVKKEARYEEAMEYDDLWDSFESVGSEEVEKEELEEEEDEEEEELMDLFADVTVRTSCTLNVNLRCCMYSVWWEVPRIVKVFLSSCRYMYICMRYL